MDLWAQWLLGDGLTWKRVHDIHQDTKAGCPEGHFSRQGQTWSAEPGRGTGPSPARRSLPAVSSVASTPLLLPPPRQDSSTCVSWQAGHSRARWRQWLCPGGLAGTSAPTLPCLLAPTFLEYELSCSTKEVEPHGYPCVSCRGHGGCLGDPPCLTLGGF